MQYIQGNIISDGSQSLWDLFDLRYIVGHNMWFKFTNGRSFTSLRYERSNNNE